MEEKETFGVELKLITSKFSEKIESVKSKISNFGKIAKKNFETGLYMDTSQAKNDLENLQKKLNNLKAKNNYKLNSSKIESVSKAIEAIKQDLNTIETSKLAKIGHVFNRIKKSAADAKISIKNSLNSSKNVATSFNSVMKETLENGIKKTKRFALSLFGIQTIWRAVSKASSAYLSQDVELSNKLQAVWVGLGSMIAPILEKLANFFLKLVGYLNVFISALSNGKINLLGDAIKKANENTKNTSKSMKELKGQLAGFDEINNIANNSNSSKDDDSNNWATNYENLQLDTSWCEIITNFGNYIRENWPNIVGLIAGTAVALKLIGTGIENIQKIGIGVMVAGIIKLIVDFIGYLKDPSWENFGKMLTDIGLILAGFALVIGEWPVAVAAAIAMIIGIILQNWDKIKSWLIKAEQWLYNNILTPIEKKFGFFGRIITEPVKFAINTIKSLFGGLFTGVKQILDGIILICKGDFKNGLISVFKGILNILIGIINTFINGINLIISPIRSLIVGAGNILGKSWTMDNIKIPTISKLDTGTNYVPEDQFAYIHKGEAVVPKKFNSGEYFGRGNEETNELLRELIDVVDRKDTNTYLDSDLIGETARKYLVKQKRLMGRGVA